MVWTDAPACIDSGVTNSKRQPSPGYLQQYPERSCTATWWLGCCCKFWTSPAAKMLGLASFVRLRSLWDVMSAFFRALSDAKTGNITDANWKPSVLGSFCAGIIYRQKRHMICPFYVSFLLTFWCMWKLLMHIVLDVKSQCLQFSWCSIPLVVEFHFAVVFPEFSRQLRLTSLEKFHAENSLDSSRFMDFAIILGGRKKINNDTRLNPNPVIIWFSV